MRLSPVLISKGCVPPSPRWQPVALKNHEKRAAKITAWLGEDESGRRRHIDRLIAALFGSNGPLSERSLSNRGIRDEFPRAVEVQQATQQAFVDADRRPCGAAVP